MGGGGNTLLYKLNRDLRFKLFDLKMGIFAVLALKMGKILWLSL